MSSEEPKTRHLLNYLIGLLFVECRLDLLFDLCEELIIDGEPCVLIVLTIGALT